MSTPSVTPYVPFDASKYVRQSDLSKIELSILSNRSHRGRLREGAESYAKALASDILR